VVGLDNLAVSADPRNEDASFFLGRASSSGHGPVEQIRAHHPVMRRTVRFLKKLTASMALSPEPAILRAEFARFFFQIDAHQLLRTPSSGGTTR